MILDGPQKVGFDYHRRDLAKGATWKGQRLLERRNERRQKGKG